MKKSKCTGIKGFRPCTACQGFGRRSVEAPFSGGVHVITCERCTRCRGLGMILRDLTAAEVKRHVENIQSSLTA